MLVFLRRYWPLIPVLVIFAAAVHQEWLSKTTPQSPLSAAASQIPIAETAPLPSSTPTQDGYAESNIVGNSKAEDGQSGTPETNVNNAIGAAKGAPLYVHAACDHGCGYSEPVAWIEKFETDPNATFALAVAAFTLGLVGMGVWTNCLTLAQLRLGREQVRLGRDEFNATHRPQLDIRLIKLIKFSKGQPIVIEWTVVNIGTGRGRVVESNATPIFASEPLPDEPPYSDGNATMNDADDRWIDPGFGMTIRQAFNIKNEDWIVYGISQENDEVRENLYFIGYAQYEAGDNQRRSVAFCRRYDPVSERFIVIPDPNYEHSA